MKALTIFSLILFLSACADRMPLEPKSGKNIAYSSGSDLLHIYRATEIYHASGDNQMIITVDPDANLYIYTIAVVVLDTETIFAKAVEIGGTPKQRYVFDVAFVYTGQTEINVVVYANTKQANAGKYTID